MPTYSFKNKTTGEEYTEFLSISERETYLAEHQDVEQILTPIVFYEAAPKPDSTFQKYVLGRIKESNPLGKVGEGRFRIPREF